MIKLVKKYKGCLIFKDYRNKYLVELKYQEDKGKFGFDSIRQCKKFIDEMMY